MSGGFKFAGVDIAEFNMEYIPQVSDIYVYGDSFKVVDQTRTGADGGYFYGTQVQPKTFSLYCVLQDTADFNIDKIRAFFKRGKYGTLVFDRRPHLTYNVRVTSFKLSPMVGLRCAYVTIQMTAYYPFSTSSSCYYPFDKKIQQDQLNRYIDMDSLINDTTALLTQEKTPVNLVQLSNATAASTILLYNGGTQRAPVKITISGDVGDGLTIYNSATKQYCDVLSVPASSITSPKYISLNAYDGKTSLVNGTSSSLAFLYHDRDYIQLAPAYPIVRNIYVTMPADTNHVYGQNVQFDQDDIGKYIYIEDKWRKIVSVNEEYATINYTATDDIYAYTDVVSMNQITITPLSSATCTITFNYAATFD